MALLRQLNYTLRLATTRSTRLNLSNLCIVQPLKMTSWISTLTSPFRSATQSYPKYISAEEAKGIDEELMGEHGAFSLDQVSPRLPSPPLSRDEADGYLNVADGVGGTGMRFGSHETLSPRTCTASRRERNQAETNEREDSRLLWTWESRWRWLGRCETPL